MQDLPADDEGRMHRTRVYVSNINNMKNIYINIHPPELCEGCFITDVRALFDVLRTVDKKHLLTRHCNAWRGRANF